MYVVRWLAESALYGLGLFAGFTAMYLLLEPLKDGISRREYVRRVGALACDTSALRSLPVLLGFWAIATAFVIFNRLGIALTVLAGDVLKRLL